jgi:hypothetical protein
LSEDVHVLTFFSHMTRADVLDMTRAERKVHVERVVEQYGSMKG